MHFIKCFTVENSSPLLGYNRCVCVALRMLLQLGGLNKPSQAKCLRFVSMASALTIDLSHFSYLVFTNYRILKKKLMFSYKESSVSAIIQLIIETGLR